MLPLPTANEVLSSSTPTSNVVFSAFTQYMWLEIGVLFAVLTVLFIIYRFKDAISGLVGHSSKFDQPSKK